jgi:hypothetical protein
LWTLAAGGLRFSPPYPLVQRETDAGKSGPIITTGSEESNVCLNNGSVPVRLRRCDDGWELELHSLVAVARDVYRPKRTRIRGARMVVEYLREHDVGGVLAQMTACLMDRFPNLGAEFVAYNGEWVLEPRRRTLTLLRSDAPSATALDLG